MNNSLSGGDLERDVSEAVAREVELGGPLGAVELAEVVQDHGCTLRNHLTSFEFKNNHVAEM